MRRTFWFSRDDLIYRSCYHQYGKNRIQFQRRPRRIQSTSQTFDESRKNVTGTQKKRNHQMVGTRTLSLHQKILTLI